MDKQIVYNSVTCLECGEIIESYHRHDYKTCECPNEAMVDGGTAYLRYGAKDMSKIKLFAVYADDDYELVRKYATRGSRGKDGKRPLTWIPLCDMDDDHLESVLDYGGPDWHMELIRKEIEYRKQIHKLNNGRGATLCHKCSVTISVGLTDDLYCDSCTQQNIPKDAIIFKGELKNGKNYLVEMEILNKDKSNFNASNYIFHRVLVWEVDKSITFKSE